MKKIKNEKNYTVCSNILKSLILCNNNLFRYSFSEPILGDDDRLERLSFHEQQLVAQNVHVHLQVEEVVEVVARHYQTYEVDDCFFDSAMCDENAQVRQSMTKAMEELDIYTNINRYFQKSKNRKF